MSQEYKPQEGENPQSAYIIPKSPKPDCDCPADAPCRKSGRCTCNLTDLTLKLKQEVDKKPEQNESANYVSRTFNYLKENVDWKKGLLFGGLAGVVVGLINSREGVEYAFSSGLKEGAKCLAIGTLNLSICQKLATSIENKAKAYAMATIVPAILSMGLTYGVHAYLKGTPHPIQSTAPTALSAPFFLALGARARRLQEKNQLKNLEETL